MTNLGFFLTSGSRTHVRFQFATFAAAGANVAPSSALEAADLRIYKAADGAAFSATQRSSANGITMTSPFDSLTGYHDVDIDLTDNTDASFYAAGCAYIVVLAPDETVDSQTLTGVPLAYFEIGVPTANVTQWLGTAAATPTVAGVPEVDITHAGGTAITVASGIQEVKVASIANGAVTAAAIATDAIDADALADNAITAATFAADAITAAKIADGAIDAATFAAGAINAAAIADGAIDRATFAADTGLQSARSNTAQAGAAGTVTLDASASATTDFYVGMWIYLTGGTGVGQARVCTAYDGTTKVATIAPNWATNPDVTSTFAIIHAAQVTGVQGNLTGSVGSVTGAVGSVTGNVGGNVTGSVGSVVGAVGSVTGAVGSVTGAVGSVTGNVGGNVVGSVASVVGAVGSVTGAVGSVTGAVGSVTGNVGGDVVGSVASVTGNVGGNVVGSVASVTAKVTPIDIDGITFANMMKYIGATTQGKVVITLIAGTQYTYDAYSVDGLSIVWTATVDLGARAQPTRS